MARDANGPVPSAAPASRENTTGTPSAAPQLGSRVVCHDTGLLYEEAPEAYKNVEKVLSALVDSGLCTVVASLRPLVTYKG